MLLYFQNMNRKLIYFSVIFCVGIAYGINVPDNSLYSHTWVCDSLPPTQINQLKILEAKYLHEKEHRQLVEKNAELRRKNMWLGIGLMLIFFCIIIGYLFYMQYTLKLRQRLQESGLEEAIGELRKQNKALQHKLSKLEESNSKS